MRKIEKIEKCQRTSKSTLNKNRGRMESMLKYKSEQGITLVALVITIVLNCSCLATERNKRIAKI